MQEETYKDMSLSEKVRLTRKKEIAEITEALNNNENVYITGKYVTGKSTLAKEMLD